MLIRIVRMEFKEGEIENFNQLFNEVKPKISSFPGCRQVKLCADPSYNCVFYTHSIWIDVESLEKYRKSALFEETWAKTKVLFAAKPLAYSLLPIDEINDRHIR